MIMSVSYDPTWRDFRDDPYPIYQQLRDESPVHWAPDLNCWVVSRYADVMHVLKTPTVFSSRAMFTLLMNGGEDKPPPLTLQTASFLARMAFRTRMNPMGFASARNLIAEDGDSHTSLRAIVNRGFSPRRIAAWDTRVREVVESCMQNVRGSNRCDVMRDLAIPLPVTIIAELLGVEAERHADFKRWSNGVIDVATGPGRDDRFNRTFQEVFIEFTNYLKRMSRERKQNPRDDLISVIVSGGAGAALSVREVIQFALLLLVAGNETTTNLIGNGTRALVANPDQLDQLVKDPDRVPQLIEETLRYDAPVQIVFRNATRDVEMHGQKIRAGQVVAALIGSANRDERQFPDPDRFDLDRDVRGHLGFGFGHHFCLGASLARLEARAAFDALVPELPRFAAVDGGEAWVDSCLVRGRSKFELERAA
jgi:cytochrome P450